MNFSKQNVTFNPDAVARSLEVPLRLDWRLYRRPFRQPLHTRYGLWQERQGILLRLTDPQGRMGFGEIAPLPWFGSETLPQAQELCQGLGDRLSLPTLASLPTTHPACRFGLAIAWETLIFPLTNTAAPLPCALLPTGSAALANWQSSWEKGHRTFKWKIGVAPLAREVAEFQQLMAQLPSTAQIRLDANGGLSLSQAERWLDTCARYPQVEFLEQPLPPEQLDSMLALGDRFPTPLALDESVATLAQLQHCHQRGWRGVFVIKPAIAGFPQDLQLFCQKHRPTVVLSSVFETAIARRYITQRLLPQLSPHRVAGLGTGHWFTDDGFDSSDPEALWPPPPT